MLKGGKAIGKFLVKSVKHRVFGGSGRWIGELAFPGGAKLPFGLQISDIAQEGTPGCQSLPSRAVFPGHAYQDVWVSVCKTEGGVKYSAGLFYTDERTNDRWFVSFDASHDTFTDGSQALQGSSFILSLDGGGSSEGKIYTGRPARFQL